MSDFLKILDVCLLICICVSEGKPPEKIINGQRAVHSEFPHHVFLIDKNMEPFCGGSIIDGTHILTAAHCLVNFTEEILINTTEVHVLIDKNNNDHGFDKLYSVTEINVPQEYLPSDMCYNDISILTLRERIIFDEMVRPIKLPDSEIPANNLVTFGGPSNYKLVSGVSYDLRKIHQRTISNEKCNETYKNIRPSQLCTLTIDAKSDSVIGDSGWALVFNNTIVGICSADDGSNGPDIATRVYYYLDWIKIHLQSGLESEKVARVD